MSLLYTSITQRNNCHIQLAWKVPWNSPSQSCNIISTNKERPSTNFPLEAVLMVCQSQLRLVTHVQEEITLIFHHKAVHRLTMDKLCLECQLLWYRRIRLWKEKQKGWNSRQKYGINQLIIQHIATNTWSGMHKHEHTSKMTKIF